MNKLLKLSLVGAATGGSLLHAQIEVTENLSLTGFIDMSALYADYDSGSLGYGLDQMELDFLYTFGDIAGRVDIDHQPGETDEIDLEQAFLTFDLGEGSSISAGKFLSYHGWETAEPTGLYQYSYAYGTTIPGYHNGITYDYSGDWGSFGVGLLDTVYGEDGSLSSGDDYKYGIEAKVVLTPMEGLTLYLGYALDKADVAPDDSTLINFWTSYEIGPHTLAFEYNIYEDAFGDLDQFLLMWNMAISDPGSFTLRYSQEDGDGIVYGDTKKYTAAYLRSLTENLAIVGEISQIDADFGGGTEVALEALFTF